MKLARRQHFLLLGAWPSVLAFGLTLTTCVPRFNGGSPSSTGLSYLSDWERVIAAGTSGAPTIYALTAPVNSNWCGGTLAPNGKIYMQPTAGGAPILVVDPSDDSVTTIAAVSSGCATGLGSNGKIYAASWNNAFVYELDVDTGVQTMIGNDIPNSHNVGYIGSSGAIYIAPATNTFVKKFDTALFTFTSIGSNLAAAANNFWGGVTAVYNENIYAFPIGGTSILKIDPSTEATSLIDISSLATFGWGGTTLDPNGNLLGCPNNSGDIIKLDPRTDAFSATAVAGGAGGSYTSSAIGGDGMLYCAPYPGLNILAMNPNDLANSQKLVHGIVGNWDGVVTGLNGKLYFVPSGTDQIMVLDLHLRTTFAPSTLLSRYSNKY